MVCWTTARFIRPASTPTAPGLGLYTGSYNVTEGNMFNSPDGMQVDRTGLIWMQSYGDDSTDGADSLQRSSVIAVWLEGGLPIG